MRVEIQVPSESVLYDQNKRFDSKTIFHPLAYRFTAQSRKLLQQIPIFLENAPEHVGHGEDQAGVEHIGKLCPLLALPLKCCSVAAAGTESRLTSVINTLDLSLRGIGEPSQRRSSALDYSSEVLADRQASTHVIPNLPCVVQDLFHRLY